MAECDSFAVEQEEAEDVVNWMNSYAKKNHLNFETRLAGYSMKTAKFGTFEVISWRGDWSAARNIIRRASSKMNIKAIESGYHEKRDLLSAMFGGAEYAKVYSGGKLVGQIELGHKSGRWFAKHEAFA